VAAESVLAVAIVYTAVAAAECRSSALLPPQLLSAVIAALLTSLASTQSVPLAVRMLVYLGVKRISPGVVAVSEGVVVANRRCCSFP
jgi:hypothetical protein